MNKQLSPAKAESIFRMKDMTRQSAVYNVNWTWGVFILLSGFNFWQLCHHVMWRDELQAWMIAVESRPSLVELWFNMSYEPQPGLWYLLLWLLSHLSTDPFLMQLFHFLCGTAAALLVMIYAPFSVFVRLLIVMGYYVSFEYLLISRNYVLGMLMIFLFCSSYDRLSRKPVAGGILLGLMANTSTYGAIISLALWGGLIADLLTRREPSPDERGRINERAFTLSASYFALLLASCILIAFSRGDFAASWDFHFDLHKLLMVLFYQVLSIIPVPDFIVTFWNTLYVINSHNIWVIFFSFLAVTACIGMIVSRTVIGAGVFLFGLSAMLALQYTKLFGFVRYSGHLFLLFLACVWLGYGPWKSRTVSGLFTSVSKKLFMILLASHVIAAVVAGYYHANNPFSGAKEMAAFIRENKYDSRPIIGHINYTATTVSAYLGRKIYHVTTGKPESFVRWDRDSLKEVKRREVLTFASSVGASEGQSPLILLNLPCDDDRLRLIKKTAETAIVWDENYYLYEMIR